LGDIIEVFKLDNEKYFRYKVLIKEGGNYAVSIILRNHEAKDRVIQLLSKAGCFYEYGEFGNTKMLAVSVTNEKAYNKIKVQLDELEVKEIISYAELCLA